MLLQLTCIVAAHEHINRAMQRLNAPLKAAQTSVKSGKAAAYIRERQFLPAECNFDTKQRTVTPWSDRSLLWLNRDAEIRTRGLTHPKGARYRAAPRPAKFSSTVFAANDFVKRRAFSRAHFKTLLTLHFRFAAFEQNEKVVQLLFQTIQSDAPFARCHLALIEQCRCG